MEKRGLIIKQFRGNECIIAISGWQFPRWKGKKKEKKKKEGPRLNSSSLFLSFSLRYRATK